jgi:DNA-binding response OmpR family regulator
MMKTTTELVEGRVLVVDDERDIRSTLLRFLTLLGYEASEASSGEQALEMLERNRYDVAVLDLRLPGIDGVEVMRRAGELRPEMAVILLTGYATLESAIAAVGEHATSYLRKPVSVHTIADAVAKAMEDRRRHTRRMPGRPGRMMRTGSVTLDRRRGQVVISGESGDHTACLTASEEALLACLMEFPGAVVSYRDLACSALEYDVDDFEAPTIVRPHICRLRKKVQPRATSSHIIQTVPGRGYLLAA